MADRNRKPVLVLATDGLPMGCPGNSVAGVETALAAGQAGIMGMPGTGGIPTYVIGVFAQDELVESTMALMRMAQAGGTNMPFMLTAGSDLDPAVHRRPQPDPRFGAGLRVPRSPCPRWASSTSRRSMSATTARRRE